MCVWTWAWAWYGGWSSDRISVTLSCLIVMATLFSQVAVTSPPSASPKLMDIYFFYSILRLLVTFIHHSIYFHLHAYVTRQQRKEDGDGDDGKASSDSQKNWTHIEKVNIKFSSEDDDRKLVSRESSPSVSWLDVHEKEKKKNSKSTPAYDTYFNIFGQIILYAVDAVVIGLFVYTIFWPKRKMESEMAACRRK